MFLSALVTVPSKPMPPGSAKVEVSDSSEVASVRHEARTRDRVLAHISQTGPVTASVLARTLGITPTAIRRHLDVLLERGDIAPAELGGPHRGRGRPARAFVLTTTGHRRMNTDYDDVARAALHYLSDHLGPDAVADFARQRLAQLENRYQDLVEAAGPDPSSRADALARALAMDGFAATTRPIQPTDGGAGLAGVQLCQGHCPMHQVAEEFPQFCEAETDAFARLLGVHVQRLATLANGEHVCTTFVPAGSHNHPAGQDPSSGPGHHPQQERTGS